MPDVSRSMADVLVEVLNDWKKFGKFLLLIMSLFMIVSVFAWFILLKLPSNASEIQIGTAHILFSQSTKEGHKYVVIVSPEGWQRTGIFVPAGARMSIEAGGKVQIDLTGMNEALRAARQAENRVRDARASGKLGKNVKDDAFLPEDYFSQDERRAVKPTWNWVGPDGFTVQEMKIADPARRKQTILPGVGYGALIASFSDTDLDPSRAPIVIPHLVLNTSFVGSNYPPAVVKEGGYLYFTVNDVQSSNPDFIDEFTLDNIGSFYAKVEVFSK